MSTGSESKTKKPNQQAKNSLVPVPLKNKNNQDYTKDFSQFSSFSSSSRSQTGQSQLHGASRRPLFHSPFLAQLANQYDRVQTLRSEKADRRRRATQSYQVKAHTKLENSSIGRVHDLKT